MTRGGAAGCESSAAASPAACAKATAGTVQTIPRTRRVGTLRYMSAQSCHSYRQDDEFFRSTARFSGERAEPEPDERFERFHDVLLAFLFEVAESHRFDRADERLHGELVWNLPYQALAHRQGES